MFLLILIFLFFFRNMSVVEPIAEQFLGYFVSKECVTEYVHHLNFFDGEMPISYYITFVIVLIFFHSYRFAKVCSLLFYDLLVLWISVFYC